MPCFDIDWDATCKNVLRRSFPYLSKTEIGQKIIKYLGEKGEDTIYGIAYNVGATIQGVIKVIETFEELGYVTYEEKPFRKKRKAKVYKLTELGKIALLVLNAPKIDISSIQYPEDLSEIVKLWLNDECLKEVLIYAIILNIGLTELETQYKQQYLQLMAQTLMIQSISQTIIIASIELLLKSITLRHLLNLLLRKENESSNEDEKYLSTLAQKVILIRDITTLELLYIKTDLYEYVEKILTNDKYINIIEKSIKYCLKSYIIEALISLNIYTTHYLSSNKDVEKIKKWFDIIASVSKFIGDILSTK
jgi:DNA-binding PadR family transcriptional regulator